MENAITILRAGLSVWILCGGAILCLIIDAIWPKKMTLFVYTTGIISLIFSLYISFSQWLSSELPVNQDLFVMDQLTLFLLFLVVITGILTLFNAMGYLKIHQTLTAEFCSLVLFSVIGMIFLFASDHLFLNFIGLETMSLSLYVLVGSHKKNTKSNEAAIKYFIMGSLSSAIILYGIALFYGAFATLKLSQLSNMLSAPELSYLPKIAIALILVGILFKLAIVPFHFWAPDVYEGAPAPVTGFMATGVKIAALGFALRFLTSFDILNVKQIYNLIYIFVITTLIMGNLLAIAQTNLKRMLAYSSISHAGFILFGLLAGFVKNSYMSFSVHAILFYLFAYLIMTTGAFAILSLFVRHKSEADDMTDLRGLGQKHPVIAFIFTLYMISLIGIPGTIGFTAKYNIIAMAVHNHHIPLALLAILVSVISAYYYLKPTIYMYFKPVETPPVVITEIPITTCICITLTAFATIYFGINPDLIIKLSKIAATSFM